MSYSVLLDNVLGDFPKRVLKQLHRTACVGWEEVVIEGGGDPIAEYTDCPFLFLEHSSESRQGCWQQDTTGPRSPSQHKLMV